VSLNNLAGLHKSQGQYAQAEPLYKRSLAIMEKALGPEHPAVATSLENMAVLFRKTGREKEAKALEKRAAAIRAIKQ
jgi:Tfp pilus assembly protein PilF